MQAFKAQLNEIWQSFDAIAGRIRLDKPLAIQPGQYLQIWREQDEAALPEVIFPVSLVEDDSLAVDRILPGWMPGDRLNVWGPLGKGFQLPAGVHFLTLAAPEGDPSRLMPLIQLAIERGAAVSLFLANSENTWLLSLPLDVEVQALAELPEALTWADFLALEASINTIQCLKHVLGLEGQISWLPCPGQVLVRTAMPCAGVADCGVCAVNTQHGWRQACSDGPVFPLEVLLDVVG